MKHRIETNIIFNTPKDIERVRRGLTRSLDDLEMRDVAFPFVAVGSVVVVELDGNGALLRNAALGLDISGMLD